MKTIDLSGRTALVTGASRGIGAAIAAAFGQAGARVLVHYNRSEAAARAVLAGLPQGELLQADLEDEAARRRLMQEAGPVDILVNNAAIYEANPWDGADDAGFLARWRRTLVTNLEAAAHLVYLALPGMRERRFGRIVMISSRAAFRGETECADYAVSKAGMVNLARCLARSEGAYGITANAICPGWIETDMAAQGLATNGDAIRAEIPLGRVGTPDDVAGAALFFASDLGAYANGTALGLNGGSFLH